MPDYNDYSAYPEHPLKGRMRLAYNWIPNGTTTLLDAGCSSGYATRFFARKSTHTYGIEISDNVEVARHRYPQIQFVRGGLESTPFDSNFFDVIIMSDVLEHVDSEQRALDEMCRILKPKGTFIVSTPHTGLFQWLDPYNYGYALRNSLPALYRMAYRIKHGTQPNPRDPGPPKHRHYSLRDFRAMLNSSRFGTGGYTIEKVFRSSLLAEPLIINAEVLGGALFGSRIQSLIAPLSGIAEMDYRTPYGVLAFNIALRITKHG